ncbi:hypothetical protein [uncultured Treponema sp.]|uniref:hypothetical protein n=1 Tax=uncultured Treponema sp. TaxID=162155 RepID=UPI0025E8DFED|nr:hypothetical protein [uncultured Treponema sp.]
MKNKKIIFAILVTLLSFLPLAAEESPMKGWYYEPSIQLNGKYFTFYSKSYNEQDGYALVLGEKLHYWLYDTLSYHNGNASEIYNKIIPKWVENMGYVIDYDNIHVSNPNTALASSVRALMKQRGANISVTLCTKENYKTNVDYVVINEYLPGKDLYKTTIYYLYR